MKLDTHMVAVPIPDYLEFLEYKTLKDLQYEPFKHEAQLLKDKVRSAVISILTWASEPSNIGKQISIGDTIKTEKYTFKVTRNTKIKLEIVSLEDSSVLIL